MMSKCSAPVIASFSLEGGVDRTQWEDAFPAAVGEESVARCAALPVDRQLGALHATLLTLVRRNGRDLTARQLTAYLTVYVDETPHTVSSLATFLHVTRPGVTRIVDRLTEFDLVAREADRDDRRRVLVRRTLQGMVFFRELSAITREAATKPRGG
jgi:DNA-binding MarR family transcriptional regulator